VAQAEFVAQSPEHHERDDVRRVLRPVQQALTALVELLCRSRGSEIGGIPARSARSVPKRLSSCTQCTAPIIYPALLAAAPIPRPAQSEQGPLARDLAEPVKLQIGTNSAIFASVIAVTSRPNASLHSHGQQIGLNNQTQIDKFVGAAVRLNRSRFLQGAARNRSCFSAA
jgi:hypothetical protein